MNPLRDDPDADAAWALVHALLVLVDPSSPDADGTANPALRAALADARTNLGLDAIAVTVFCMFGVVDADRAARFLPCLDTLPADHHDTLTLALVNTALLCYRTDEIKSFRRFLTDVVQNHPDPDAGTDNLCKLVHAVLRLAWDSNPTLMAELADEWPARRPPATEQDPTPCQTDQA